MMLFFGNLKKNFLAVIFVDEVKALSMIDMTVCVDRDMFYHAEVCILNKCYYLRSNCLVVVRRWWRLVFVNWGRRWWWLVVVNWWWWWWRRRRGYRCVWWWLRVFVECWWWIHWFVRWVTRSVFLVFVNWAAYR